jgi:hypothetical protein
MGAGIAADSARSDDRDLPAHGFPDIFLAPGASRVRSSIARHSSGSGVFSQPAALYQKRPVESILLGVSDRSLVNFEMLAYNDRKGKMREFSHALIAICRRQRPGNKGQHNRPIEDGIKHGFAGER